ncbi:PTS sugar transporter subunit IIC, partial [Burkholderia contaminans]|nr:PTS sugar transporter subunit IIC [Burkholderia contaminans]
DANTSNPFNIVSLDFKKASFWLVKFRLTSRIFDAKIFGTSSIITLFKIVPIFLAIMLGGEYVADLFAKVPPIVMQGLNSAGALLPSIGFG